jgi:AcrR family transcriptional regulator
LEKDSRRAYHHGDLRQALLDVALDMLEKSDSEQLSLRAIARQAGVSRAAPYHHFTDREALLSAVAAEGFKKLRSEMTAPADSTDSTPLQHMQDMGVAYVRFAVAHPRLYMLMFSSQLRDRETHPELKTEADAALASLASAMSESMQREGNNDGNGESLVLGAWALVHGLAMLIIDGRAGGKNPSDKQVESLVRNTTRIIGRGVAG